MALSSTVWRPLTPSLYRVRLDSSAGPFFTLEIHRNWAPIGADRLYHLARAGFFDEFRFSRVVPHFVAKFGTPAIPRSVLHGGTCGCATTRCVARTLTARLPIP
ncbi:MAG: peptidylprolyl isomerase [Gemmatimonadaceae bacterium]|nr:peptidylprolyl isomerase [Gemmatimonadaceae bacterium]